MAKFLIRLTDIRNYPNTLNEFEFRAPDMTAAIKFALHNEGCKRPAKIYAKGEIIYSALLSNKKFAEKFIDIYYMEEESND